MAVKRIDGTDSEAEKSAKREAKLLAHLTGEENVVRLFAAYRHNNVFTLYLELCETDLLRWMKARRQPPGEVVVREVAKQTAKGIDAMHALGIVHRDIKPANLLLKPNPEREFPYVVKLSDFGLAEHEELMDDVVCGTPHFMAPEMLMRRGKVDRRIDLYSLGTVLYHLCTKAPPVRGKNSRDLQQQFSLPTSPTDRLYYPATSSATFRDLCNRLLRVDPSQRPTIAEVRRHPFLVEDDTAAFVVVEQGLMSLSEGTTDSFNQQAARRIAMEALRVIAVLQQSVRRIDTAENRRAVLALCHTILARASKDIETKVGTEVCESTKKLTDRLVKRRDHFLQFTGDSDVSSTPHVQRATLWRLQHMALEAADAKQFKVADALTDLVTDVERALPNEIECSKALSGDVMSSVDHTPITTAATATPIPIPNKRARFCFSCGERFNRYEKVCVCGEARMYSC